MELERQREGLLENKERTWSGVTINDWNSLWHWCAGLYGAHIGMSRQVPAVPQLTCRTKLMAGEENEAELSRLFHRLFLVCANFPKFYFLLGLPICLKPLFAVDAMWGLSTEQLCR